MTGNAMKTLDLFERAEQAYRMNRALHALVGRGAERSARVITLSPKLQWDKVTAPPAPQTVPPRGLPTSPLVPPTGHAALSLAVKTCEILACDVLGLRGPDLEDAVATIETLQRRG